MIQEYLFRTIVRCTVHVAGWVDTSSRNNEWIPIVRRGQPPISWLETNAVYQSICQCLPLLVSLLCPSLSVLFFLLPSSVSALMILNTDRESHLSSLQRLCLHFYRLDFGHCGGRRELVIG